MTEPWISVVVPAFNEEAGIERTVRTLREWLEQRGRQFEILVVDNASTDRTCERLAPLIEGERVRLLRNDCNRGKGHSVRRGMLEARGVLRLHCDADCAVSLPSLPRMLELIEDVDVVVGSRLAPGARLARRQPLRRRIMGRTFVALCRRVLREPTRDLYCGFKLWRAEAASATFSRIAIEGWVFDAESLAMARALGYRIAEAGIAWSDREGSRLSMPRVLFAVIADLLRARRNVARYGTLEPSARVVQLVEPAKRRP
jgi:glycosyltransferase involved in cell wall biosynthesis